MSNLKKGWKVIDRKTRTSAVACGCLQVVYPAGKLVKATEYGPLVLFSSMGSGRKWAADRISEDWMAVPCEYTPADPQPMIPWVYVKVDYYGVTPSRHETQRKIKLARDGHYFCAQWPDGTVFASELICLK